MQVKAIITAQAEKDSAKEMANENNRSFVSSQQARDWGVRRACLCLYALNI